MFAMVGRTISEWSMVELSLCNIFTVCITPCPAREVNGNAFVSFIDWEVPCAIFYSVENFRGKLSLIDAALTSRIKEQGEWANHLREEWARLREKVRKLSLKRNQLAHWTVAPAIPADETGEHPARLMPPYGSPGWWKETGANPTGVDLSARQLSDLLAAFALIGAKLNDFHKTLATHPRLTGKFDQLTVRLIRSHRRLSPTRAEWIEREIASQEKY